jgi:hypothetical protein
MHLIAAKRTAMQKTAVSPEWSLGDFEPEILDETFIPPPAGVESDSRTSLVLPSPVPSDPVTISRSHLCALTALYTGFTVFTLRIAFVSMPANITLTLFAAGCLTWFAIGCILPRYTVGLHARVQLNQVFPLFFFVGSLGSVVPARTLQVLLAGVLQSYIMHEWLIYITLLSNLRSHAHARQ